MKTKKEVIESLMKKLKKGYKVCFDDNRLSYPGITSIHMIGENRFKTFSYGQGWSDRIPAIHTENDVRALLRKVYVSNLRTADIFLPYEEWGE